MATYEITAPNGAKYRVTAPDTATQDEVLSRVKAQSVADDMSNTSWGQVATSAIQNAPGSAVEFAKNVAQPFLHPIDTAKSLADLNVGMSQKLDKLDDVPIVGRSIKAAAYAVDPALSISKAASVIAKKLGYDVGDKSSSVDALVNFFKDRYGSVAALKKTISTDPVGVLADASVVLSGGGAMAERAPGLIGQAARAVSTAGRIIDPVNAGAKGLRMAGGLGAEALGLTTGVGGEAIRTAASAGAQGGEAGAAFRRSLSGSEDMSAVVEEAKGAVNQLRQDRGEAYRKSMADIGADNTVLDFDQIDKAVTKVENVQKFKGQDLSPTTAKIRDTITQAIEDWRKLPAADYHTPEGLDALKKKIGDIRDATQFGTPERVVADSVYRAIRKTIVDQAPEYGRAMAAYEQASDLIREIEGTLSLKPNANIDTTLRKLQSVLRNNVSTNYGRRAELIDFLQRAGAPHLIQKLAGQTLATATPRGLSRLLAGGEGAGAIGALLSGNPLVALGLGGGLAASSPALMGGAAYAAGSATRLPLRMLGRSAFQVGRFSDANAGQ